MGNFRDKRGATGNSGKKYASKTYGNKSFGGGSRFEKPVMHKAVCSECGAECEVPFKPNGKKPVMCHKCYKEFGDDRPMHKTTCSTCGKTCEVPFKPSGMKPIYCKECFGKEATGVREVPSGGGAGAAKKSEPSKDQFAILNTKLDKILKMLGEMGMDQ